MWKMFLEQLEIIMDTFYTHKLQKKSKLILLSSKSGNNISTKNAHYFQI